MGQRAKLEEGYKAYEKPDTLKIVSSCPRCGAPIYARETQNVFLSSVPLVAYTCDCKEKGFLDVKKHVYRDAAIETWGKTQNTWAVVIPTKTDCPYRKRGKDSIDECRYDGGTDSIELCSHDDCPLRVKGDS